MSPYKDQLSAKLSFDPYWDPLQMPCGLSPLYQLITSVALNSYKYIGCAIYLMLFHDDIPDRYIAFLHLYERLSALQAD